MLNIARAFAFLAVVAFGGSAIAQPGPGQNGGPVPPPSPWLYAAPQIYPQAGSCVTMPQTVAGGCPGGGNAINVAGGYYLNGVQLAGIASVTPPLNLASNVLSLLRDSNFAVNGSNQLALATSPAGCIMGVPGASPAEPSCTTAAGTFAGQYTWTAQQIFEAAPIVSLNTVLPTLFGDNVMALAGPNGGGARISIFLPSNTTNGNVGGVGNSTAFTGEYFNGTLASPLPIVANNNIVSFGGGGLYCATCVAGGPGWVESRGSFQIWSSNVAWSASSYGTEARIFTTVNNTTTQVPQFTVWNDGGILIGTYSIASPPYSLDNGQGTLYINAATQLAAGMSALTVNATNAGSPSAKQVAVNFNITGAGSASQINDAVLITYNAGYTGNKRSIALDIDNLNAGTCAVLVPAAGTGNSCGNMGMAVAALGTTTGYNFGIDSFAAGGAINVGGAFKAQVGASNQLNVGLLASAIGANNNIGIFASLNQTTVPGVSAAGVFDNGATSSPVALFMVNGTTVVTIDQSGNIIAPTLYGGTAAGSTLTLQSTSNGSPSGDDVSIRGSTIVLRNPGVSISSVQIGLAATTQGEIIIASPVANAMTVVTASSATGTATIPSGTYNFVGDSLAQALTNKTLASSTDVLGGVTMTLGSDATGDIYYRNSSGLLTRLGIGGTGDFLTVAAGIPAWSPAGAITSVSNSDGTLTISPTTGAVVASINLTHVNAWTGAQTFSGGVTVTTSFTATGLVTNADLANSTISGVALGSNLAVLTYSTHLTNSAGASSYNGSAASTLATDATNANTASTIVARDASGNFLAGTITASLTGHASLDCALAGCTYAGSVIFADGSTYSSTGLANLLSETIVGGTLASLANVLSITATQPASPSGQQNAIAFTITGAGNASQSNTALNVTYSAGYIGSSTTSALSAVNTNAGTGGSLGSTGAPAGNGGGFYSSSATTAGYNLGISGRAGNGNVNFGVIGSAGAVKNSAVNIGVVGIGINTGTSPVEIGVWATLGQTTIPGVSAALIADTAGQSSQPIALFQVGQVTVASVNATGGITATLTQTSAAQSGTICYNSSTLLFTYDATLGCLTSLEEMKDIHGPITGALAEVEKMKPFWFSPINRPAGSDLAEQPGFGAHQIEAVDRRLVGYSEDGKLRGVRYMEMTAVLAAAIQELKADNDNLRAELRHRTSGDR
jgi:hypothetical protein